MMTRKDYVEVANILNDFDKNDGMETIELIYRFAALFEKDNPRFDRQRFIDAVIN